MRLKPMLLVWLWRQALPVTLVALPIAAAYVLLLPEVMDVETAGIALLFIVVHCLALVLVTGRPGSSWFGFIYTRGFSRRQLWVHGGLGLAAAALTVWLPVALLVWLRGRSLLQDRLFLSPSFPAMAPNEDMWPWYWLAAYPVLLTVFAYAWIRRSQPIAGRSGGRWLGVLTMLALLGLPSASYGWDPHWFWYLVAGFGAVVVVLGLWQSYRLHQRLEVQA